MHYHLAAALIALAAAADPPTSDWIRERAREHEAFLRGEAAPEALFRERDPGEKLFPDFSPPRSLAPLVRAIRSGVVNISTVDGSAGASGDAARKSLGSGFILSPDGYVVTNNHVVAQARQIRINLADGRDFLADVVGRDPSTDVALLHLRNAEGRPLPYTYLGDSDALEVGDWVVAIGNPFGLDHSLSHGMISAKERVLGIGMFDDFIQTDALINPGNSGGPLFNMRGEVVGVNTAIVSHGQGIGFAVPINMVKDLLPNLRVNGHLERGWLGVNIREGEAAEGERGAVVSSVYPGSPAAAAGIRPGDRVMAVNGRQADTYLQLLRRVSILAPGSEARLLLKRADGAREVLIRLAERPGSDALDALGGPGRVDEVGLVVKDVTAALGPPLNAQPSSGVLVAGVIPGSAAELVGLKAGDLITEVNNRKVRDVRSFRAALGANPDRHATLIRFERAGQAQYVAIEPG